MKNKYLQLAVGKRKTSIARLYLKEGSGKLIINGKSLDEYMQRPTSKKIIYQPLELTESKDKYDIKINVCGGGLAGQAGAIRHAIARALVGVNEENRKVLKQASLLTRDARKKERNLPGQPGARKKFQFSKR
jgi:small subunit ribosomal protein S9